MSSHSRCRRANQSWPTGWYTGGSCQFRRGSCRSTNTVAKNVASNLKGFRSLKTRLSRNMRSAAAHSNSFFMRRPFSSKAAVFISLTTRGSPLQRSQRVQFRHLMRPPNPATADQRQVTPRRKQARRKLQKARLRLQVRKSREKQRLRGVHACVTSAAMRATSRRYPQSNSAHGTRPSSPALWLHS